MEEAVAHAKQVTPAGGVVLLSPAAPSYGYYRDFAERGRDFAAKIGCRRAVRGCVMRPRSRRRHCSMSGDTDALCDPGGGATVGCAGKPYLTSGDANSAAVGYSGDDPAVATAVAKDALRPI